MVQNIIINLGYFNEQADAVGLQIRPSGLAPGKQASQPRQYEVNENSMKSQQYPYEVNVLSKRVRSNLFALLAKNLLREGRQLLPVGRVNFFRMDRQMLKNKG